MIAVDGTPLVTMARSGVAHALRGLLAGWTLGAPEEAPEEAPVVLYPDPGEPPRAFRRRLPALIEDAGCEALYSPWSAFPRVDVPVVALVHELPFVRHGALEGRVRTLRHRRWLKRNVRDCAAIVVPSEATRDDLLALHPEADERVHVVPNGFDPSPFEAVPAPEARRPGVVVMVGLGRGRAGARKKGLDVLLEARRRAASPRWRLDLVGAPGLALPEQVRVMGGIDDETLREIVARAAVLVYPSRSEGFGYPPLEAMALGVPVLTTDAGSIPEVVGEAALVVPSGDAEALADGLSRLLEDETLRARLIAAGRVRCRAFDPRATAGALRAVFTGLGVSA